MPDSRPVHDPTVLRAIAHPVRNRILTALEASGPLRAADIARELGIPANQASFHLRQLAKYGLVEEDPSAARDRRDRVWRPTAPSLDLDLGEIEKAPGGQAASAVFRRTAAARGHAIVDVAYDDRRDERTFRSVQDSALRLTREEARELTTEIGELLRRRAEATRGADDERRTYLYWSVLMPHPDLTEKDDTEKDDA